MGTTLVAVTPPVPSTQLINVLSEPELIGTPLAPRVYTPNRQRRGPLFPGGYVLLNFVQLKLPWFRIVLAGSPALLCSFVLVGKHAIAVGTPVIA